MHTKPQNSQQTCLMICVRHMAETDTVSLSALLLIGQVLGGRHLLQNIGQLAENVLRQRLERGNAGRRVQRDTCESSSCAEEVQTKAGEHMRELHLRRKSVYWECLMRPVLIMMVWKPCRSIAHSLMSVRAADVWRETDGEGETHKAKRDFYISI